MRQSFDFHPIPEPSLRRLPTYLQLLRRATTMSQEWISCTHIAWALNLDPSQVRKDLEAIGIEGKPRIGYPVKSLTDAIETFLGLRNSNDAFLVGTGHLGSALLGYRGFSGNSLTIVAAFDIDEKVVGNSCGNITILPMDKLASLTRRMAVRIGIIAVPADAAQGVADTMVENGITAIWNFAPVPLTLSASVIVEDVNLASSLAVLTSRLSRTEASLAGGGTVPHMKKQRIKS